MSLDKKKLKWDNFLRHSEIDFTSHTSIHSEGLVFLEEYTLPPWRQQDIQFVSLAVSVKDFLEIAYAGWWGQCDYRKRRKLHFCYHFQVKRQIPSVVLLQGCLHSNRCDPQLSFFIGLCPVDRCISRIHAPAVLIFGAGIAKTGPLWRALWWEVGKGLRSTSSSLCIQYRNCPCPCPILETIAVLFPLEALFSLVSAVGVDLWMWPWFSRTVW